MSAPRDARSADAGITERSPDRLLPAEQMTAMRQRTRELLDAMYDCLNNELLPELRQHEIVVESFRDLGPDERAPLTKYFNESVAPVLTPLAIDPGHPFPFVANLALNIAVTVESGRGEHIVLFKIPPTLSRFIRVGIETTERRFVPIGSLIVAHLDHFFPR
jgi:polyphosphate kinase